MIRNSKLMWYLTKVDKVMQHRSLSTWRGRRRVRWKTEIEAGKF
jgi:hypothetical protein